jgi:hypothetical protein
MWLDCAQHPEVMALLATWFVCGLLWHWALVCCVKVLVTVTMRG